MKSFGVNTRVCSVFLSKDKTFKDRFLLIDCNWAENKCFNPSFKKTFVLNECAQNTAIEECLLIPNFFYPHEMMNLCLTTVKCQVSKEIHL